MRVDGAPSAASAAPVERRGEPVRVAVVVIGRNEAPRLRSSLQSARRVCDAVLYVDSASADGSPDIAAELGLEVVHVDPARPLSAARARNEGFERALRRWPDVEFVQFVDGDCEIHADWLRISVGALAGDPAAGIVCGRIRERDPGSSVWARLIDAELRKEPGDVAACGGIFLVRVRAFVEAGGFDPSVVAGEEPELCLRVRRSGFRIRRLAEEMAVHECGIDRMGQWWRRSVRSGVAYAQAVALHGRGPERLGVRESLGIAFWTLCVPALTGIAVLLAGPAGLAVLVAYPLQIARIARGRRRSGDTPPDAWRYAVACVVAKFAQLAGQVSFWGGRARRRAPRAVEFKGTAGPARDARPQSRDGA